MSTGHAVVTGGSSGIGAAVVDRFLDRGMKVSVFDLHEPDCPKNGVDYFAVDVTDHDAVDSVFTQASENTPAVTLVTCHGVRGSYLPALELAPDQVRRVLDVHVMGTLLTATAFARQLLSARQSGSIVTIASTTAFGGWKNQADYGTAKAAIRQLTQNLAIEWAPQIRVNCVAPGHTLTPMVQDMVDRGYDLSSTTERTPLARLCTPDEMARAIENLALDATFTTGVCLPVDGGWTVVGK